jgi:nucleolar protein TMA23
MNSENYLVSYGWKKGEALKKGGLKKPILVKHKKDTKGLGHRGDEQDAWWERVFDGQLKSLDVSASHQGDIKFTQKEVKVSGMKKSDSPLYRMFVFGGHLEGTIESMRRRREVTVESELGVDSIEKSTKKRKKSSKDDSTSSKRAKSKDKKKKRKEKLKSKSGTPSEGSEEDWIRSMVRSVSEPVAAS